MARHCILLFVFTPMAIGGPTTKRKRNAFAILHFVIQNSMIFSIILNIKFALDLLVPVVVALALIYFIWGIIQYVIAQSEENKNDAKSHIIYGIIAMFVIVSIWGITNFIAVYLGITPYLHAPIIPIIPPVHVP